MASIQIFPLNINGINSPLNLIDQILAPTNYSDHLLYPIDLASNPQFCHAIQFTVHEYEYENIKEAYSQFTNVVVPTAQKALQENTASVSQTGQEFIQQAQNQSVAESASKVGNAILGVASNAYGAIRNASPEDLLKQSGKAANLIKSSNFRGKVNEKILSTISLYLPDTLTTSFDSDYTSISLTETFGITGYLGNALSDDKTRDAFGQAAGGEGLANLLNSQVGKSLSSKILGRAIGGGGIFEQALNVIPNPQLQLLYKGIGLREFQFEFIFTPTSSQEADAIDQIINTFIYYSLPELNGPESAQNMFFKPPQVFKIQFAYTGDQGAFSQVGQVLRNTITQALGTQLSGAFGPSGQSKNNLITNAKNAKIFEIKECVLSNVQLDYAPNGWAAYQDGFPIQTRMTLQFKEMTIQTKADYVNKVRNAPKTNPYPTSSVDQGNGVTTTPYEIGDYVPFNQRNV